MLQGSKDSPMWKRGKISFSNTRTRLPARAKNVATLLPPGPHPITKASYLVVVTPAIFHENQDNGKPGAAASPGDL
jgi:hypothetical protein